MAIGPVQLIVLSFHHPESLAVYKDTDGEPEVQHRSNLTSDEAIELVRRAVDAMRQTSEEPVLDGIPRRNVATRYRSAPRGLGRRSCSARCR